jgi:hypothetical protein
MLSWFPRGTWSVFRSWTDKDEEWFRNRVRQCRNGDAQPKTSHEWYNYFHNRNNRGVRINKAFEAVASTALKRFMGEEVSFEILTQRQKKDKDEPKGKDKGKDKSKSKLKLKGKGKAKGKGDRLELS